MQSKYDAGEHSKKGKTIVLYALAALQRAEYVVLHNGLSELACCLREKQLSLGFTYIYIVHRGD